VMTTLTPSVPALRDARDLDPERRAAAAMTVRGAADVRLPPLAYFNSDPCPRHGSPDPSCGDCGIVLRPHQRAGAAWLYLAGRGLLADQVGSGKTAQVAGMLALCKETGELGEHSRAVVICRAAAVLQWQRELRRMLPELEVSAVTGSTSRAKRTEKYLAPWEIMVISERTFASARGRDGDVELLRQFPVGTVIFDDVDAMRTHRTQTARSVKALAAQADRVYAVNATPLQKRLPELHSVLEALGGNATFGSLPAFRRRFVRTGETSFYQRAWTCTTPVPCPRHESVIPGCRACRTGHLWPPPGRRCPQCGGHGHPDRTGRTVLRTVATDLGVKNVEEFKFLLAPFVLRRTEFGGVGYPDVQVSQVWLELSAAQRDRYAELRRGVLRRLRDRGEEITRAEAAAAFTRAWQICSGLATIDDGRDVSSKLDWAVDKITGDLDGQKVVVFSYFTPNVEALSRRLDAAGIGHVLMWSRETDAAERDERVRRFTRDPGCRVLIGTSTIEGSLNLQAAGHLICVDAIRNPARMTQVIGRIRRQGSAHQTCFVHMLLARDTIEEAILPKLALEQGMADSVFGEASDVFPASMAPADIMRMIAGGES